MCQLWESMGFMLGLLDTMNTWLRVNKLELNPDNMDFIMIGKAMWLLLHQPFLQELCCVELP